mgnify:CR=1 FL=1
MAKCNRCGNEFDNWFQGTHWCVHCGMQFITESNKPKEKA